MPCLYLLQQIVVETKIHRGCKDEEKLVTDGGLWFMGGDGIYVTPGLVPCRGLTLPGMVWDLQAFDFCRKEFKNKFKWEQKQVLFM